MRNSSRPAPPTPLPPTGFPGQDALRGFKPHLKLKNFPQGATIATSSTRRKEQLLAARPDLNVVEIRGNVTTRMQKVAERGELDATVLALAGITRLNFRITPEGKLEGDAVPDGLLATVLDVDVMLPCVGQGAIGIEIRADDERIAKICERLNHFNTFQCVAAERAFLRAMGGGFRVRWLLMPKLTAAGWKCARYHSARDRPNGAKENVRLPRRRRWVKNSRRD